MRIAEAARDDLRMQTGRRLCERCGKQEPILSKEHADIALSARTHNSQNQAQMCAENEDTASEILRHLTVCENSTTGDCCVYEASRSSCIVDAQTSAR